MGYSTVEQKHAYMLGVVQADGVYLVLTLDSSQRHLVYNVPPQAKCGYRGNQLIQKQKMACLSVQQSRANERNYRCEYVR